jgi:predicted transcriptional regulator
LSYRSSMKQKTSITLSPETIRAIDDVAGKTSNRSRVIEMAVLEFLERRKRRLREARDLEILDAAADELNREVEDVLDYQAEL